jgi:hypothetical protein
VLRVIPGEEELHQFPQGLSLNGVYGRNRASVGEPYFCKPLLKTLTCDEWPRKIGDQWHYVKPSPEARVRADEIIDAFNRFWTKTTRKSRAYRAADRAKDAAMHPAWDALSDVYSTRARTLEGLAAKVKLAEEHGDNHVGARPRTDERSQRSCCRGAVMSATIIALPSAQLTAAAICEAKVSSDPIFNVIAEHRAALWARWAALSISGGLVADDPRLEKANARTGAALGSRARGSGGVACLLADHNVWTRQPDRIRRAT